MTDTMKDRPACHELGRGVSVLDADPASLTAALIDRYLELKTRMLI